MGRSGYTSSISSGEWCAPRRTAVRSATAPRSLAARVASFDAVFFLHCASSS
jgi:hypothetical protein